MTPFQDWCPLCRMKTPQHTVWFGREVCCRECGTSSIHWRNLGIAVLEMAWSDETALKQKSPDHC